MKIPNLNIREKMLLLVVFLVSLVSFLIIVANNKLTEKSRGAILTDISGKMTEVQKLSEQEFTTFRNVVNEGILEASGLVAIENIVSIAVGHQKEFYNVVQDELGKVGQEVGGTLDSQYGTVRMGLKRLSDNSKAMMEEIINSDNQSLSMLSNVAVFNIDSLKEASNENIEIFSRNIDQMDGFINLMQEKNKHDIDNLLAETIVTMDTLQGVGLAQYLVQRHGSSRIYQI
jgi:archaellum component FlaC